MDATSLRTVVETDVCKSETEDGVHMVGALASRSEEGLFEGRDMSKYLTWENADGFELESLDVSVDAGGEIVVDVTESTVIVISVVR